MCPKIVLMPLVTNYGTQMKRMNKRIIYIYIYIDIDIDIDERCSLSASKCLTATVLILKECL